MNAEFADTATEVEQFAVGAAQTAVKTAADVASDPIGTARRQVRNFQRKGTPTVRRINRRLNALIPDKITVLGVQVNAQLPEKMAIKARQLVKFHARGHDLVGDVAKRTLRIFNGGFKTIARSATRLEQASELAPKRQSEQAAAPRRARRRAPRRRAASPRSTNEGAHRLLGAPFFSASLRRSMVLCTGSIAFDYILSFKGRF